jgi:hypothetical protein
VTRRELTQSQIVNRYRCRCGCDSACHSGGALRRGGPGPGFHCSSSAFQPCLGERSWGGTADDRANVEAVLVTRDYRTRPSIEPAKLSATQASSTLFSGDLLPSQNPAARQHSTEPRPQRTAISTLIGLPNDLTCWGRAHGAAAAGGRRHCRPTAGG